MRRCGGLETPQICTALPFANNATVIKPKGMKHIMSSGVLQQEYQYFAFISYSRKDKQWASWLQQRLESYRLPTHITHKYDHVPKRITPVFRDQTDLAGVVLQESLEDALAASRYLIVIASPNSAASEWVGKEIEYFRAHGAENRIIPFIVDGTPFSEDAAKECFNEQLRQIVPELMGVSVEELGKHNAFLRLIASMLSLKYDELLMRDRRRRRRNRAIISMMACLLLLFTIAGVWYNTEHTAYYRTYEIRFEIPRGIDRLSAKEQKAANHSYRVTTLRGKVIRLESVDSFGNITPPLISSINTDYPKLVFHYGSDGALIRIEQYNENGELATQKILTRDGSRIAIDFRSPSDSLMSQTIAADVSYTSFNQEVTERSEIVRQINTYDEETGLLLKAMYYRDSLGTPACDSNGIYGRQYQYDQNGWVTEVSNLSARGTVRNCKFGWATVRYEYDAQGRMVSESFYNEKGQLVRNQAGIASELYTYDDSGNIILGTRYDEAGAPVLDASGVCMRSFTYNENGFIISEKHLSAAGEPAADNTGLCEKRFEYNAQGLVARMSFFDADGNAINCGDQNCARIEYEYTPEGQMRLERFFDGKGNPCCSAEDGAYAHLYEYDEYSYICYAQALDAQLNPIRTRNGFSAIRIINNANGQWLSAEFLDEQGGLALNTMNYALEECSYDAFGNMVALRYYDENRLPCNNTEGYHGIERAYEDGRLVSEKYVSADGTPAICRDYYHALAYEYDEHGNCISFKQYDAYGKLIENSQNYAEIRYRYDEYGRVLEQGMFDRYGNYATIPEQNYHRSIFSYDERGNVSREDGYCHGAQGSEHHVFLYECDEYGFRVKGTYFLSEEQMAVQPEGAMQEIFGYDPLHRLVWNETYYPDYGQSEVLTSVYDAHGYLTEERLLITDTQGGEETIESVRYVRDELGNCLRTEYYDGSGSLSVGERGYAVAVCEYTPEGYISVQEFYGESNEPLMYKGVFRQENRYDAAGNIIEQRRYGTNRQLLREADGEPACTVQEYDSRGNLTYRAMFNEHGEPGCFSGSTAHAARYCYTDTGFTLYYDLYAKDGSLLSRRYDMPYVSDVAPGSYGARLGIRAGDVILQYANWCYFDQVDPFTSLRAEIGRVRYEEKELLLCRNVQGSWKLIPVRAETADQLGLQIQNIYVDGFDSIHEAYQGYQPGE